MKARSNAVFMNLDRIKWLLAVCLLLSGIAAGYFYSHVAWPLRVLGWLALLGVVTGLVLQTEWGSGTLGFFRESRIELRKVFWPTRQETVQTTVAVVMVVAVLGLLLWGMDSILVVVMGWLTGQRG